VISREFPLGPCFSEAALPLQLVCCSRDGFRSGSADASRWQPGFRTAYCGLLQILSDCDWCVAQHTSACSRDVCGTASACLLVATSTLAKSKSQWSSLVCCIETRTDSNCGLHDCKSYEEFSASAPLGPCSRGPCPTQPAGSPGPATCGPGSKIDIFR
jgi:hypothetical protein